MLKVLQNGYSGLVSINNKKALATSYDLTINQNYIKSQGAFGSFFDKDTKKFSRLGGLAYRDFAGYELSVSLQATISTFEEIMEVLNNHRKPYKVQFQDAVYGCDFSFSNSYINSVSLQISNNSLTSLQVGFFIVKRDLQLKFNETNNALFSNSYGINDNSNWGMKNNSWEGGEIKPSLQVMPYYGWGFKYQENYGLFNDNYASNSIMEMSFQWQQSIEMKHGCTHQNRKVTDNGKGDEYQNRPIMLVFGIPSATFNVNMLLFSDKNNKKFDAKMGYNAKESNNDTKQHKNFYMKYGFNNKNYTLTISQPLIQTFTPSLGNRGDVNTMNIQGSVLGGVKFE